MSGPSFWTLSRKLATLALGLCLAANVGRAAADEATAVAHGATPKRLILRRPAGSKQWQVAKGKSAFGAGDLLIGLPGSGVISANEAVLLVFQADLDRGSPYPIRESAVVLHANSKADLDLALDRGRVDLVNTRKEGAAKIHLRVQQAVWELTLVTPGSTVALEMYGRWPAGVPFTLKPGPKDVPNVDLLFLVLKGEVVLKHNEVEQAMAAPPGPALIEWDNFTGLDESPRRLEDLPKWSQGRVQTTARGKKAKEALERFATALANHPLGEVLDRFLASDREFDRRLALIAMAATDDLERLAKALREAKHPDVWENGICALRHWIGRGPGQDQIIYRVLTEKRKFSHVHAETVLQLLHSFGETDLAQPETYQTLIDYLDHDLLAIRGLAYWHLVRLVPDGQKIGYDPLEAKDNRETAIEKWRKLVPKGKVPPRAKPQEEKNRSAKDGR